MNSISIAHASQGSSALLKVRLLSICPTAAQQSHRNPMRRYGLAACKGCVSMHTEDMQQAALVAHYWASVCAINPQPADKSTLAQPMQPVDLPTLPPGGVHASREQDTTMLQ